MTLKQLKDRLVWLNQQTCTQEVIEERERVLDHIELKMQPSRKELRG